MHITRITRSDYCLNCGIHLEPLVNYCPQCGQLNNTRKESGAGVLKELITDFIHLDHKVASSLFPLLFKPGYLTNEYNSGRRARYLHPVRLFISVTIIMLVITSIQGNETGDGIIKGETKLQIADSAHITLSFDERNVRYSEIQRLMEAGITNQKKLLDTLGLDNSFYNRFVMNKATRLGAMTWNEVLEYFKHKIPWLLFALMPVFAIVLWIIYIRKRIWYVDHLIFSFHLHSATFILISLNSILGWISTALSGYVLLYIPVYYFVSLRNVYKQRWRKTLLKGIVTGMLYAAAAVLFSGIAMLVLFILI
jgi:hypothetical protein